MNQTLATKQPTRAGIWGVRAVIAAVTLCTWQFLPSIEWLRDHLAILDPFFISSPALIIDRVWALSFGIDTPAVWGSLADTLWATFLGVSIGTVLGGLAGLLLSGSPYLNKVLSPFVTFFNAVPRVALIPIFVIIAGPTVAATVLTAIAVVFFIVFYNALSGGQSVPVEVVQSAKLLGASNAGVLWRVRLPYVYVWTFASLPNAISFGIVAVVTAEILTGRVGMGRLLLHSISSVDSTLTFAVVFFLAVVGVIVVTGSELLMKRALHWWERS